ncbi:MAG TPA: A24 family peptidase [Methylobacter sp.]|jgi:prepilin peptidase CpaA
MIIIYLILIAFVLIAAIYDAAMQKIPNWTSLVIVLLGLGWNFFSTEGLGVRDSSFGLLAGFLLMLPSYVFGGMGAGDVKLMAAIGSVVGLNQVLNVVFSSYMAMFVMAILVIAVKGDLVKLLRRYQTLIYGLFSKVFAYQKPDPSDAASGRMPLAPAIALATCYVLYPALSNSGLMANLWNY